MALPLMYHRSVTESILHRKLPNRRIDPVVRGPAARLVPDRAWTLSLKRPQQPMNLSSAQSEHVGRRHSRHPALGHVAQYFNAVQLALAHDHQSHSHTPIQPQTGKCDTSCRCGTF